MLQTIVHRGPDDSGVLLEGSVGLGFRRLSILDLSPLGHQPMNSTDGRYTIIFNGEIYNYLELRKQLEAHGWQFRSTGDTEVLLASYQQWGPTCVERFNGMWAFIIYDRVRRLIFGSRDRFGIKPLYRWHGSGHMLLASEVKAIRASGIYKEGLNLRTCAAYLYEARLDETNETFFNGIVQVPAGHSFELVADGSYREWPYWHLDHVQEVTHADAAAEFAQVFEDSMREHMRSDVAVGVNLSGGLDSSSIICEMAQIRGALGAESPMLAFCYQDKEFDESRYVADTLAQTGAQLVRLNMSPEQLWDSMPKVIAAQDAPVHAMSAVVGYHLMALARQHGVKVVLNGQGADEVLAGYGSYFPLRWKELSRKGQFVSSWNEIAAYSEAFGGNTRQMFSGAVSAALRWPIGGFLRSVKALDDRRQASRLKLVQSQFPWVVPSLAQYLAPLPTHAPGSKDLRSGLMDSIARAPLPLYLRVEDRNSMAHSVESRLPFLDHRLVELAFSLGSEWKVRGHLNKYVQREAMRGRIPESVRSRVDKMGFSTGSTQWLRGPLKTRLLDVLGDPSCASSELFEKSEVDRLVQQHFSGAGVHTGKLLTIAQFQMWRLSEQSGN